MQLPICGMEGDCTLDLTIQGSKKALKRSCFKAFHRVEVAGFEPRPFGPERRIVSYNYIMNRPIF